MIFVFSFLFFVLIGTWLLYKIIISPYGHGIQLYLPLLLTLASLLSSLTSCIGFIITTILAWRKEKRDLLNADIDIEKKLLELEKLKRELAIENKHDNNALT